MKYIMYMLMIIVMCFLVIGIGEVSLPNKIIKSDCEQVIDHYNNEISYIDQYNTTTKENDSVIANSLIPIYRNDCKESVKIGDVNIDFNKENYNCKETEGHIICDSCTDGNCDGICDPNGGETCAKIVDGNIIYKNSNLLWNDNKVLGAPEMVIE